MEYTICPLSWHGARAKQVCCHGRAEWGIHMAKRTNARSGVKAGRYKKETTRLTGL